MLLTAILLWCNHLFECTAPIAVTLLAIPGYEVWCARCGIFSGLSGSIPCTTGTQSTDQPLPWLLGLLHCSIKLIALLVLSHNLKLKLCGLWLYLLVILCYVPDGDGALLSNKLNLRFSCLWLYLLSSFLDGAIYPSLVNHNAKTLNQ